MSSAEFNALLQHQPTTDSYLNSLSDPALYSLDFVSWSNIRLLATTRSSATGPAVLIASLLSLLLLPAVVVLLRTVFSTRSKAPSSTQKQESAPMNTVFSLMKRRKMSRDTFLTLASLVSACTSLSLILFSLKEIDASNDNNLIVTTQKMKLNLILSCCAEALLVWCVFCAVASDASGSYRSAKRTMNQQTRSMVLRCCANNRKEPSSAAEEEEEEEGDGQDATHQTTGSNTNNRCERKEQDDCPISNVLFFVMTHTICSVALVLLHGEGHPFAMIFQLIALLAGAVPILVSFTTLYVDVELRNALTDGEFPEWFVPIAEELFAINKRGTHAKRPKISRKLR